MTEAQKKATDKYFKKNIRQVVIKLNKVTDKDLIEFIDSLENIQGTLKQIIREKINKEGKQ